MRTLALLWFVSLAPAEEPKPEPIFNGKDLKNWTFVGKDADQAFSVKEGVVVCKGRPVGYMATKRSFKNDFTLTLEWRYARPKDLADDAEFGGNSGYLLFVQKDEVWPRSIEVQGKNRDAAGIIPIKCKAKFVTDKQARKNALKPVGEWNALKIVVEGGTIRTYLNAALISTVTEYEPKEGRIGFQSEGAEIHWRKIAIKTG
jgi:hypothetical protein